MQARLLIIFLVLCFKLQSTSVTLHNTTARDLYISPYYEHTTGAERIEPPVHIAAHAACNVQRPVCTSTGQRKLVFAYNLSQLAPHLPMAEVAALGSTFIGTEYGNQFFISEVKNRLMGYNPIEWNIVSLIKNKTYDLL